MRFYRMKPEENILVDKVLKWMVDIFVVIMVAVFFVEYMCTSMPIVGNSMAPALKNKEHILIDKVSYHVHKPARYDIAVFSVGGSYQESEESSGQKRYIKRIIGLPGETILIQDGKIYIDGKPLSYSGNKEDIVNPGIAGTEIKMGSDEYFLLGDNWNNSEDSRSENIGKVNRKDIIGKAWFVSSPFSSIGFID